MKRTTVYLPDDLKLSLTRAAFTSGRSEAELIREGVGLAVNRQGRRPRIPLYAGPGNLAEHVDQLLKGFGEDY